MILKNLVNFIKNNKRMFVLLIATQISAVIIILFSYGIYRNNQYKLAEEEAEEQILSISFNSKMDEDTVVEVSRIQEDLVKIVSKYDHLVSEVVVVSLGHLSDEDSKNDEISGFNISPNPDVNRFIIRSCFKLNGGVLSYGRIHEKFFNETEGRNFTMEEFIDGSKVCFVSELAYRVHDDYWTIDGITYKVIAHEVPSGDFMSGGFGGDLCIIPFNSLAGEMELDTIFFELERPLYRSEYEAIKEEFTSRFTEEEMYISDFYAIEIDEKATMKTMMLASVFMSLISAFSVCLIYRYMLTKRVKTTAVYRICGCTAPRSALIYIGEMVMVLVFSCLVGSILFELMIEPRLEKNYTWFAMIYEDNSCYKLIAMYFAIVSLASVIMIALKCNKTPKEMLYNRVK